MVWSLCSTSWRDGRSSQRPWSLLPAARVGRHNPGLCIFITRLPVDDLKDFVGASMERIDLEDLSPKAGAAYLEHLGVKGTQKELKQTVGEFDGHALALTLLGKYLAVVYGGDIRKRDKIARLTKEKKQGGHARRVLASYERWFKGKSELNILRIVALFDHPAEGGAIEAFRAKPAIKGLTSELQGLSHEDWQYAVDNLRTARPLDEAGHQLQALGRSHDAIMRTGLAFGVYRRIDNWREIAFSAGCVNELYLYIGRLKDALLFAETSLKYANDSKILIARWYSYSKVANILH